mgnify:CR=1 FL=1
MEFYGLEIRGLGVNGGACFAFTTAAALAGIGTLASTAGAVASATGGGGGGPDKLPQTPEQQQATAGLGKFLQGGTFGNLGPQSSFTKRFEEINRQARDLRNLKLGSIRRV